MQYFVEIFTPTKFHEILHHYVQRLQCEHCGALEKALLPITGPYPSPVFAAK